MPKTFDSLSYSNQFQFTCPLFNTTTRMGACVKLRDMFYAGVRTEVRRGCQAAMACSKCPASEMVRRYAYNSDWDNDHHGSKTPKDGKLMLALLERIRPVMMRDNIMDQYRVPDAERALLLSANTRIDEQMRTAPGKPSRVASEFEPIKSQPRKKIEAENSPSKQSVNQNINQAAITGDLAAAINA